ncbi:MAG: Asp-tRNA(Asn)/Glu-tRNA(Gln) amidotransferase subunit GatA, partial [Verrucomicrobiae bacterium]|nr:Asp-tRNA(Asn)/Glu-tRNA(Gln) amidotransferase subunit GatA [Verrucomicrobiae bacterium]
LAGHDPKDATSARRLAGGHAAARRDAPGDLGGVRIGLDRWALEEAEAPVRAAIEAASEVLKERGATLAEVTLPLSEHALSAYALIAAAEASSNLARFDGVRFGRRERREDLMATYRATRGRGFGPEVKRRILLGTYALRAGYADRLYEKALALRARLIEGYRALFRSVDALLSPTSPGTAFRLGERLDDPLSMYRADRLTLPSSLAGLPALSLPVGMA